MYTDKWLLKNYSLNILIMRKKSNMVRIFYIFCVNIFFNIYLYIVRQQNTTKDLFQSKCSDTFQALGGAMPRQTPSLPLSMSDVKLCV